MTAASRLLDHLEGVRVAGPGKWQALCPAHADRNPSLSIDETEGGDLLLFCHAGCAAADVVERVGLAMADLFAETANGERGGREIVAEYGYVDEVGKPLYTVVRFSPKGFAQRLPDGTWGLNGATRVLFRLPAVLSAVQAGETVYVVEGERDVLALERAGVTATCNPMGAGKWRDTYAESLVGADVVVVADQDEPGRRHARQVAASLEGKASSVRIVEAAVGKDAADHLAAGKTIDGFIECATAHSDSGRATSSTLISFIDVISMPVRWAWRDRVALSKITALAGRPKIGKGLLYSHLIAQVTRGTLAGDLDAPRDVILVTTEDDAGDTLKPRLMAAGADLARVSMLHMGSKDEPVPFRVPQDAAELGKRVAETEAGLVVLDPLMEFIDGKVDSHKSHPVRQAVAALNQIARGHGCAVLAIFHLNKGVSTDPLLRHEGSAAFTQVVRGGLMLGHDPDDPDGEDGSQRVLAVSSSNLAPIAPSLVYRIDTATVSGDLGDRIVTARMTAIGESAAGAGDLLRGQADEEDQSGTDEAEELLRQELANGPRPVAEIQKAARALGVTDKQLRRARTRLGVESAKAGFEGGWEWSLPKAPQRRRPPNHREEGHLGRLRDSNAVSGPAEGPEDAQGAPLKEGAPSDVELDWDDEIERLRREGKAP